MGETKGPTDRDIAMTWKRFQQHWFCEGNPPDIGESPKQRVSNMPHFVDMFFVCR